jgi:hypothetical protein
MGLRNHFMFREASTRMLAEARKLVGPSAHPHPDIRMVDVIIHFRYSEKQRLVTRAQHGSDEKLYGGRRRRSSTRKTEVRKQEIVPMV